jgi:hypothetical protein
MFEKYIGVPNLMYERACAMSLGEGDQVLAADGTLAKVTRKIAYDDQKLLEVCVDDARLRVTPTHRITVPRTCTPVEAKYLHVGDDVVVSSGPPKKITQINDLVQRSRVFALTFQPDIPIASYFPPSPMILSMGQLPRTPKPTRRGSRRSPKVASIPDTEGEYRD